MGVMVLIGTDGKETYHEAKKFDIHKAYDLIGCSLVQPIKVRYEGRVREAWLDEEGFWNQDEQNPKIKRMAEDYYGRECQVFMGPAVVWVPVGVVYDPPHDEENDDA